MAKVKVLPRPGRMVSGEPLEEVFDRHYADVYRYLARRVPVAVAEDLASETFAQVAAKGNPFDPRRGVLRGWIFGIASNLLSRHHRDEERAYRAYARTAEWGDGPGSALRSLTFATRPDRAGGRQHRAVRTTKGPRRGAGPSGD